MNANINSASHSEPTGSGIDQPIDPVDWEARYQIGDTPWDKSEAAPPLTDFLAHQTLQGTILVPGCGAGHDVRALVSQDNAVVGLDLSDTAIAMAQSIPPIGNETYEQGDLFALPSSWDERFDWVVEHTCFCAIPPIRRKDYVRAVIEVLKPGGLFFAIFFLNPDTEEGPPFGTTKEEIAHFFDPSFELLKEWVPGRTFEGREGRELCQLRRKKS